MNFIKLYSVILSYLVTCSSYGQIKNYYLVVFKDKASTPYSISTPINYLSQKSIDRRTKQGYNITESDLPVDPIYVDSLKARSVEVKNTSRWFNAALVYADSTLVKDTVDPLSFVESINILSNYGNTLNLRKQLNNKFASENISKSSNTSTSNLTQLSMLEVYDMHLSGYDGDSITIAVMDDGFNNVNVRTGFSHLFSNNQIIDTYDFVEDEVNVYEDGSHGTNVLSVIAGKNGTDNLGAAPEADFYLFRTEDGGSEFPIEEVNWLLALEKADSLGVDIVNTSLGYRDFDDSYFDYEYADSDGNTAYSSRAAKIAARTGMLLVNSAGNSGNTSYPYVSYPADADSIVTVGAVNSSESHVSFSSIGPTTDNRIKPNVAAQGLSTVVLSHTSDVTNTANGTSFSSPLIAGFAAALWQAYPDLTNIELKEAIENAGHINNSPTNQLGYGIPTFSKFQINLILAADGGVLATPSFSVPNPVTGGYLKLYVPVKDIGSEATIILVDSKGNKVLSENASFTSELYESSFDYSILTSGVYYLKVFSSTYSNALKILKIK